MEVLGPLERVGKVLIIIGILIALMGLFFLIGKKPLYLGKLPGDIYIKKSNFSLYVPLTTCILISVFLTLVFFIINLFRK
ncbi:MAG: DUF2905 domain-containing protein [Thermodesulfobacteriota bacterium]|nr:DUF2905 domain-containing protein [Thermodesulfobacteriota bacterium]